MEFIVNYDLKIFLSLDELSDYFAQLLKNESEHLSDKLNLALSGGNTPKHIFQYLSEYYKSKIDWNKINFFWGDERCAPPNDSDSNYKMAYESLLSKVSIPEENIFRIRGEEEPSIESARYSSIISKLLPQKNNLPQFDLVMLGLGEDGHIASIFPNQMNLLTSDKICEIAVHPESKQKRITLTGKVIGNARNVVFIVTGTAKSKIVNEILNGNISAVNYPASFMKPKNGNLIWLLDEAAVSLLKGN